MVCVGLQYRSRRIGDMGHPDSFLCLRRFSDAELCETLTDHGTSQSTETRLYSDLVS